MHSFVDVLGDFEWGMIGMTGVPPYHIWSDIFLFLSVFKVIVISVIFRVIIILGIETFIIVTGIGSSSSSCGSSAVKTCEDMPKRRMLLWAIWYSEVALLYWRSITIRSPSPWGTGHDALVNQNSKEKKNLPLVKLPGAFTQTASFGTFRL